MSASRSSKKKKFVAVAATTNEDYKTRCQNHGFNIPDFVRPMVFPSPNKKFGAAAFSMTNEEYKTRCENYGFDFLNSAEFGVSGEMAIPIPCSKEKLAEDFSSYVEFGIQQYNNQMGKKFKVVGIEKGNRTFYSHFLTFTAVDDNDNDNDEPKVFQLKLGNGKGNNHSGMKRQKGKGNNDSGMKRQKGNDSGMKRQKGNDSGMKRQKGNDSGMKSDLTVKFCRQKGNPTEGYFAPPS